MTIDDIEDAIDRYLLSRGIDVVQFIGDLIHDGLEEFAVDKDINDGSGTALQGSAIADKR